MLSGQATTLESGIGNNRSEGADDNVPLKINGLHCLVRMLSLRSPKVRETLNSKMPRDVPTSTRPWLAVKADGVLSIVVEHGFGSEHQAISPPCLLKMPC